MKKRVFYKYVILDERGDIVRYVASSPPMSLQPCTSEEAERFCELPSPSLLISPTADAMSGSLDRAAFIYLPNPSSLLRVIDSSKALRIPVILCRREVTIRGT